MEGEDLVGDIVRDRLHHHRFTDHRSRQSENEEEATDIDQVLRLIHLDLPVNHHHHFRPNQSSQEVHGARSGRCTTGLQNSQHHSLMNDANYLLKTRPKFHQIQSSLGRGAITTSKKFVSHAYLRNTKGGNDPKIVRTMTSSIKPTTASSLLLYLRLYDRVRRGYSVNLIKFQYNKLISIDNPCHSPSSSTLPLALIKSSLSNNSSIHINIS